MRFGIQILDPYLKCDALGCTYTETAKLNASLIGKPCPICGANLLTQQDFEHAQDVLAIMATLNTVSPITRGAKVISGPKIHINPHDGELKFSIE